MAKRFVKIAKNVFSFQKLILNLARIIPAWDDTGSEFKTYALKEHPLINKTSLAKAEQIRISSLKS